MPLGFHIGKSSDKGRNRKILDALKEDLQLLTSFGFRPCAQIFARGPQRYNETITHEEIPPLKHYIRETGATIVIHGAYVDHPWSLNPGSLHNIKKEMKLAAEIGATGVIVHLGSKTNESVEEVIRQLSGADKRVTLWLEIHAAKQTDDTFETPEKLCALFDRIKKTNTNLNIGLCIDTAHIYACGVALTTREAAERWIAGLPDVPIMVHLNDSATELGSGRDVHAALTHGYIWKDYVCGGLDIAESGLCAILDWADSKDLTVILERDSDSLRDDLKLVRYMNYFMQN